MADKYPKQKVIAVDVDDTLIIDGEPNYALVDWLKKKDREGYYLILWSMRGQQNAIDAADQAGCYNLFNTIMSKPGYIVDDDGWNWTQHTEVISPEMKVIEKRKRKPTLNSGAAMRRNRNRKRSKL